MAVCRGLLLVYFVFVLDLEEAWTFVSLETTTEEGTQKWCRLT